jgi:hypothetical protein
MSKPNNRLIKLSMEQLRKIDISRAEIFHGVAKHMPNTPEARYVYTRAHWSPPHVMLSCALLPDPLLTPCPPFLT